MIIHHLTYKDQVFKISTFKRLVQILLLSITENEKNLMLNYFKNITNKHKDYYLVINQALHFGVINKSIFNTVSIPNFNHINNSTSNTMKLLITH